MAKSKTKSASAVSSNYVTGPDGQIYELPDQIKEYTEAIKKHNKFQKLIDQNTKEKNTLKAASDHLKEFSIASQNLVTAISNAENHLIKDGMKEKYEIAYSAGLEKFIKEIIPTARGDYRIEIKKVASSKSIISKPFALQGEFIISDKGPILLVQNATIHINAECKFSVDKAMTKDDFVDTFNSFSGQSGCRIKAFRSSRTEYRVLIEDNSSTERCKLHPISVSASTTDGISNDINTQEEDLLKQLFEDQDFRLKTTQRDQALILLDGLPMNADGNVFDYIDGFAKIEIKDVTDQEYTFSASPITTMPIFDDIVKVARSYNQLLIQYSEYNSTINNPGGIFNAFIRDLKNTMQQVVNNKETYTSQSSQPSHLFQTETRHEVNTERNVTVKYDRLLKLDESEILEIESRLNTNNTFLKDRLFGKFTTNDSVAHFDTLNHYNYLRIHNKATFKRILFQIDASEIRVYKNQSIWFTEEALYRPFNQGHMNVNHHNLSLSQKDSILNVIYAINENDRKYGMKISLENKTDTEQMMYRFTIHYMISPISKHPVLPRIESEQFLALMQYEQFDVSQIDNYTANDNYNFFDLRNVFKFKIELTDHNVKINGQYHLQIESNPFHIINTIIKVCPEKSHLFAQEQSICLQVFFKKAIENQYNNNNSQEINIELKMQNSLLSEIRYELEQFISKKAISSEISQNEKKISKLDSDGEQLAQSRDKSVKKDITEILRTVQKIETEIDMYEHLYEMLQDGL